MADGLTKISARQLFSDRIQNQQYRLVHDDTYTAAKKKNLEQRKLSERESCFYVCSEHSFDNMCLCFHDFSNISHNTGHSFVSDLNFKCELCWY